MANQGDFPVHPNDHNPDYNYRLQENECISVFILGMDNLLRFAHTSQLYSIEWSH